MDDCISNTVFFNTETISSHDVAKRISADGLVLYEVLRVIDGIPLFVEDHITRIIQSANILNVRLWYGQQQIHNRVTEFIKLEKLVDGNIKFMFTFSPGENYFLLYQSRHLYPTADMYANGVRTATLNTERQNPNAKNVQPFKEVAENFIKSEEIYEAILVDSEGNVTEGSRSNIFFLKNDVVVTAQPQDVLLGITRKYVIEACSNIGLSLQERKISAGELPLFNAAFISGTSPKVLPIHEINDITFNCSSPVLRSVQAEFDSIIMQYITKNKH